MTHEEKAVRILAIIMEELNMPKGSTIGDASLALNIIDPEGEIMKLLTCEIRDAVIDEIKAKISA